MEKAVLEEREKIIESMGSGADYRKEIISVIKNVKEERYLQYIYTLIKELLATM